MKRSMHSVDGRELANYVLDFMQHKGWKCTPLSLQKLLYFCHAWFLVKHGEPLVEQEFEAWEYGPVLQYIYREFRQTGDRPIATRLNRLDRKTGKEVPATPDFDASTMDTLNEILEFYGRFSASRLVDLTHVQGGPWERLWNNRSCINPGMRIKNHEIKRFYEQLHQNVVRTGEEKFQ